MISTLNREGYKALVWGKSTTKEKDVGRNLGTHDGNYQRRVKIPIFKSAFVEDADMARFEEMLRANHKQNDIARYIRIVSQFT